MGGDLEWKVAWDELFKTFKKGLALSLYLLSFSVLAVSINITGMSVESGEDCGPAPTVYRFTTDATYDGVPIDVLLTVTAEDNDLAYVHYFGSEVVYGCVAQENNYIRVDIKDDDADDNAGWLEFKLQIVERGTNNPIVVDRILLTSWDLDKSTLRTYPSDTDDIYLYVGENAHTYLNAESKVTYYEGIYPAYGAESLPPGVGGYNVRLEGYEDNCNDDAATPDPTCRGGMVALRTSEVYFRLQNDDAYGTISGTSWPFRRFFVGLDIEKLNDLFSNQDYGDAPSTYGEAGLAASANLLIGPGFPPDEEDVYLASTDALGDDQNPANSASFDDEDGVFIDGAPLDGSTLVPGQSYNLTVEVYNEAGYSGYLSVWADWNADGDFGDAGEHILDNTQVTESGAVSLNVAVDVPEDAARGLTFMRFIYSQNPVDDALGTNGGVGEVEDYQVLVDAVIPVSGALYEDLEPNGTWDDGDRGISETDFDLDSPPELYVKLFEDTDGDCENGFVTPGIEVVAVDDEGQYRFEAVSAGDYCLVLASNDNLDDASPFDPTAYGWLYVRPPQGVRLLTITEEEASSGVESDRHDYGFFHGSKVEGRVFRDTGDGTGTANDGFQNGEELGVPGVRVRAYSGDEERVTETDAEGRYTLFIPYAWGANPVYVGHDERPASGYNRPDPETASGVDVYLASSYEEATAGDSKAAEVQLGAETDTAESLAGSVLDAYNFGVVYESEFRPDQTGSTTTPGTVTYRHSYKPGTQGTLNLSRVGGGYTYQVRVDSDCDQDLEEEGWVTLPEGSGPELLVDDAWPRNPDGSFMACAVEVRVLVPDGEPEGAIDIATIEARLSWGGNAAVVDLTRVVDTTTVRIAGGLRLEKLGCNASVTDCDPERYPEGYAVDVNGKPQDVLEYCIRYTNIGTEPVSNVVLQDPVPFFAEAKEDAYVCADGSVGAIYWKNANGESSCLSFDVGDDDAGKLEDGVVSVQAEERLDPGAEGLFCYRVQIQ